MTRLDLVSLGAGPVIKDDDLFALALFNHGGLDLRAADGRLPYLDVAGIGHQQDMVENDLFADLLRQCFDANGLAHAGAELLSAYLKDCIHDDTPDVSRSERTCWFMTNRSGLTL
jgi:hypothetical protein